MPRKLFCQKKKYSVITFDEWQFQQAKVAF